MLALTVAAGWLTRFPMHRFAAYFYFGFAGYFTPQTGGGFSHRKL